MIITAHGVTDTGPQREKNDDFILVDDSLGLYIVCDGVGGSLGGHVASELAAQSVRDRLQNVLPAAAESSNAEIDAILKDAVQFASQSVYETAQQMPHYSKMGTTLSLVFIRGTSAHIAHVGDSSVFIRRGAVVHKLTQDHTFVGEMVRSGEMSLEAAAASPFAHVLTRWIGQAEALQVDTLTFEVLPDDVLLLCSDGLDSVYEDKEELAALLEETNFESVPHKCIELANKRDGSDNSSVIIVAASEAAKPDTREIERVKTVSLSISTLEKMYLFEGVQLKDLMQVIERSAVYECEKDKVLIREGEQSDTLFVLLEGAVTVLRHGQQLAALEQGSHFGEMALLNNDKRSATVVSSMASKLLMVDRQSFMDIVRIYPDLGAQLLFNIARALSSRLQTANNHQHGDPFLRL